MCGSGGWGGGERDRGWRKKSEEMKDDFQHIL